MGPIDECTVDTASKSLKLYVFLCVWYFLGFSLESERPLTPHRFKNHCGKNLGKTS